MRTVPFSSVLAGVGGVLGLEPAQFTAALQAKALAAIQRQVQVGWKFDYWPELTPEELRAYRPAWDGAATYAAGDVVYFAAADAYFAANASPATPAAGESPDTDPAKWTETTDFSRYISLTQTGETRIDEVEGVYRTPPSEGCAARLPFALTPDGIVPRACDLARVWVKFRRRVSQFTLTAYSGAATYAAGALVLAADGECYMALAALGAGQPVTDATKWELQPFPAFLQLYVTHAAAADLLKGEGQKADARDEMGIAETRLAEAHDEQFPAQGQFTAADVRTY